MQEGRSLWYFPSILCIWGLTQACIWVKFLHKSPGMLTHLLTLANPASGSTHPSSQLPLTPVDCSLLSTALVCSLLLSGFFLSGTFLPSLVFLLSHGRSRMQALCVGFMPKQKRDPLTSTHPNPNNECPTSCHIDKKKKQLLFWSLLLRMIYTVFYSRECYVLQK